MKVKWVLRGMDDIKNRHLEANAQYWKFDVLLNAQKVLGRMKKSRMLRLMGKGSEQLKNMMFMVENKACIAQEDIDNLIDFEVSSLEGGVTEFVIFVNDAYFSEHDMLANVAGKRMKRYLIRTKIGRQQMIDEFQKEIRERYTKDFSGFVLEDDGRDLLVR